MAEARPGRRLCLAALALAGAAQTGAAGAQLSACTLPATIVIPGATKPRPQQRRIVPIGGYTLALSWSPQHCADHAGSDSFQCARGTNRFGFVLHGLWPAGTGGDWPQYCRPAQRMPFATIRRNLCATPSARLLQHEWAKHGTCMSRTPDAYFDRARGLFGALRFPDMAQVTDRQRWTVGQFKRTLAATNRRQGAALDARAVQVTLNREGWLEEVLLCLDRRFAYTACPEAARRGAADARTMRARPVG
jgi:ribonuclease T2